jgi:cobaltochelatase CobS
MTQTNRFVVAETFGVKASRGLTVEGFADPTHPQIPVKRPYVFREHLRDVLAFLADPAGDGLLLTGPTGAGKTSLVLQVAARLNWPVQEVTCHGRMEHPGIQTIENPDGFPLKYE